MGVRGPSGTRVEIARPQVAAVLAMLWDEARPVRRDELAELLWGEWDLPTHWTGAVRGVLAKARAVLEEAGLDRAALQSESGLIHLRLPVGSDTDLGVAESLVARAGDALAGDDADGALRLATEAVELLGRPVAIVAEGDWPRRLHLRAETFQRQARRLVVRALLAADRATEAVTEATDLVARDRLDEAAHELLITANLAAGHRAAAVAAHATLIEVLETELGAEPSPRITALLDDVGRSTSPGPTVPRERFLGREAELAALAEAHDDVRMSGSPRLVVVQGPAGIGKSRLVRHFVSRGCRRALWGRCHGQLGEPFEPLVDAFRGAVDGDELVGEVCEETRAAVARALASLVDQDPSATAHETRARRARGVEAVVDALAALCTPAPMVLVVDDLQWASGDSIGLLQRILERRDLPLLMVVTARNRLDQPGAAAELFRAAPTRVVSLEALDREELLPLATDLAPLTDRPIDPDALSMLLLERTGGLPYYLTELGRDARRRNHLDFETIPDQVRAWIQNRVASLPGDLGSLLEVAAVAGLHPSVSLIEATWVGPPAAVLPGVEQLVRAGLLTETDDPDEVTFPHQITRQVVVSAVGSARRARLHGGIAAALVAQADIDPPHARIAYHYANAGTAHALDAARHGYLAGVASLTRGAWDQADAQLSGALEGLGDAAVPLRAATLVALGWTRHARGDAAAASRLLDEAWQLATRLRLPHEAARAALLLVGRAGRGAALDMADSERSARLWAALEAVSSWDPPDDDAVATTMFPRDADALATLRTAVEVELAWALLFTGTLVERTELVTGALQRARDDGAAPPRLAMALLAQRNVLCGPGDHRERLAPVHEVLALPRSELPVDLVASALLCRHEDLLVCGDRAGAEAALAEAAEVVQRHPHPYWRWACATWQSLWLLVDGRADEAEAALAEAHEQRPDGSREAAACGAVQIVAIRLAQGRAGEVVDALEAAAAANPAVPAYRAVLALAAARAGDLDRAEKPYRAFADEGFATVPVDSNRLLTMAVLGDVAADLGDVEGAAVIDEQLAADDGLFVVLNCYGGGGSWWGPVSRVRARLARTAGCAEAAEALAARATSATEALGAAMLGQPLD